jgi:hypothetical protein
MGVFGFSAPYGAHIIFLHLFFFAADDNKNRTHAYPMTTAAGSRATETFASPLFGR